jgi:hypothetical protein
MAQPLSQRTGCHPRLYPRDGTDVQHTQGKWMRRRRASWPGPNAPIVALTHVSWLTAPSRRVRSDDRDARGERLSCRILDEEMVIPDGVEIHYLRRHRQRTDELVQLGLSGAGSVRKSNQRA